MCFGEAPAALVGCGGFVSETCQPLPGRCDLSVERASWSPSAAGLGGIADAVIGAFPSVRGRERFTPYAARFRGLVVALPAVDPVPCVEQW